MLILAGAGSGKTRVIVHRIACLIKERRIPPQNILAVTFTNKAAEEMKSRVNQLLGARGTNIWISTFHSSCVRILRQSLPRERSDFVIYDDDDSLTLIKGCLAEMKVEERALPPRAVSARIAAAKNDLMTPEACANLSGDFLVGQVASLYHLYQKKLVANNALDFGDLIFRAVDLLQQSPEILLRYQNLFRYILIDEYQDTNRAQYVLTKLLAGGSRNLCVVGDDDQSVYRWRGADIQNILNFESDYAGCKVIRLEQNYRSTKNILHIANQVISHNSGRKGKSLWTDNAAGGKAVVYVAQDEKDEARYAIGEIMRMQREEHRLYNDFAIFYRTNAQSRVFEDELRKNRVPYTIFGGMKFYDRKEIKDILATLRVLVNPRDSLSLKRMINVPPRGLGAKAIEHLEQFASEKDLTLYESISRVAEISQMPSGTRNKITAYYQMMESLKRGIQEGQGLSVLMQRVVQETGYADMLEREKTVEAEGRIENIGELLNVADEFEKTTPGVTVAVFLDQVALVGQTDDFDPEKGILPMMTLHLAKGLEFPVVFLVGMEEGLFPHSRSLDELEALEEERRLCYVGLTRAREKVLLTLAGRRSLYGGDQFNLPSRFLEEIPEELVERIDHGTRRGEDVPEGQSDTDDFDQRPETERLKIGMSVSHPTFGLGVVRRREGSGGEQKVTVYFDNGQVKTLMVKFANLSLA